MKMANCPICKGPALRMKYEFAPQTVGTITVRTSPVIKVRCAGECKGVMRASTARDAVKAWNAWTVRKLAAMAAVQAAAAGDASV